MNRSETEIRESPEWIAQTVLILDSYRSLFDRDLIERSGDTATDAERLFAADRVVLSHTPDEDPILNFGNRVALELWEIDLPTLLRTPSRTTAEPMHRDERSRLLERTTRDGYVDDYRGVRISGSGKRFWIERATVWNLTDAGGKFAGQAATFTDWTPLPTEGA